jgi:hypothetical protein
VNEFTQQLAKAESELDRASKRAISIGHKYGGDHERTRQALITESDLQAAVKGLFHRLQQAKRNLDIPPPVRLLEPARPAW